MRVFHDEDLKRQTSLCALLLSMMVGKSSILDGAAGHNLNIAVVSLPINKRWKATFWSHHLLGLGLLLPSHAYIASILVFRDTYDQRPELPETCTTRDLHYQLWSLQTQRSGHKGMDITVQFWFLDFGLMWHKQFYDISGLWYLLTSRTIKITYAVYI